MSSKASSTSITPTLAQFAVPRTGGTEMIGRYCPDRDVWVLDDDGGVQPIVALRTDIAETSTLTRVRAEQDDTDVSPMLEAVTGTSTAVRAEADDEDRDRLARTLLMVTTKTDANVERDDVVKTLEPFEPQAHAVGMTVGVPIH